MTVDPFFYVMLPGKKGCHLLTFVTFTPHSTSYHSLPQFEYQLRYDIASTISELERFYDSMLETPCNAL